MTPLPVWQPKFSCSRNDQKQTKSKNLNIIFFDGDVISCMYLLPLYHFLSLILGTPSPLPWRRSFWMVHKVTSGCKLSANYVFHAVGLRDKSKNKLNDCYECCLQKVSVYNVKFIALCCIQTGIPGFGPRKATEMALSTARLLLE